MDNDEKTTEIEMPLPMTNIVRVNFTERRKVARPPAQTTFTPPPFPRQMVDLGDLRHAEWSTPLWVRVAALTAILALSLFVL